MQLHQRHQCGTGRRPEPVCLECGMAATRPQRLRALARLAARAAAECGDEPQKNPAMVAILSRKSLVVEGNGGLSVPVPFSEIAYAPISQDLQSFVIALAPASAPSVDADQRAAAGRGIAVWLLVLEGGKAALRRQLCAFGECGVVRGDLPEEFSLADKPFAGGSSATVYEARALHAPHNGGPIEGRVAAKVISMDTDAHKQRRAAKPHDEVALLLVAQGHPNIIRFRGVYFCGVEEEDEPNADGVAEVPRGRSCQVVFTDLCPKGDLHDRVVLKGAYVEAEAVQIATDLLSALAHLHDLGVVHRDVKPANVLLGADGRPILTDFGIAARLEDAEAMRVRCGTPGYMAPEILMGLPYGKKVDTFGAGVVLYYSLVASTPFINGPEFDVDSTVKATIKCDVVFPTHRVVTAQMKQYIRIILTKEAEDRPTAKSAIQISKLLSVVPAGKPAAAHDTTGGRSWEVAVHQEVGPSVPNEKEAEDSASEVENLLKYSRRSSPAPASARSPQPPAPQAPPPPGRAGGLSFRHFSRARGAQKQGEGKAASEANAEEWKHGLSVPSRSSSSGVFSKPAMSSCSTDMDELLVDGSSPLTPVSQSDGSGSGSFGFGVFGASGSSASRSPSGSRCSSPTRSPASSPGPWVGPLRRLLMSQTGSSSAERRTEASKAPPAASEKPAPAALITSMNPSFLRRRSKDQGQ